MKMREGNSPCSFSFDFASTELSKQISLDLDSHPALMHDLDTQGLHESAVQFYNRVQKESTLKKYSPLDMKGDSDARRKKTFAKFLTVHDHMSRAGITIRDLPARDGRVQSSMRKSDSIWIRAKAVVRQLLTPFTTEEWFLHCKNSKGSSIGVPYADTSAERKLTYPLSCTARVVPFFEMYLSFDPRLKDALDEINSSSAISHRERYHVVEGSNATTVPKDDTIDRMIAIEPTLNMFFQQGLMTMMYERMANVGLDVNSLPLTHKRLARESSISGLNATIDFSSASDCVGYEFMQWLLPPAWFKAIDICRSPVMTVDGQNIELNIISTMGNAVTFPLETIVFWALGHAVLLEATGTNSTLPAWKDLTNVSVFGDDCILPTVHAPRFIEVCEMAGFIVNRDKSFYGDEGFRESCGGDYLHGVDVRPFNIKAPPNGRPSSIEPWVYTCLNKIIPKYMSYFGDLTYVYDKSAFSYLFGLLKERGIKLKLVPAYFPEDSGLMWTSDILRFLRCYDIDLNKISQNIHGTYRFQFCRFQYQQKLRRNDLLRLALWLKEPHLSPSNIDFGWKTKVRVVRRKGGYVVGVGRSSTWTLPLV